MLARGEPDDRTSVVAVADDCMPDRGQQDHHRERSEGNADDEEHDVADPSLLRFRRCGEHVVWGDAEHDSEDGDASGLESEEERGFLVGGACSQFGEDAQLRRVVGVDERVEALPGDVLVRMQVLLYLRLVAALHSSDHDLRAFHYRHHTTTPTNRAASRRWAARLVAW